MRGCARRRTALTSSSLSVSSHDVSQGNGDHRIRRVEIATGATTTLAGSGTLGFLDGAGGSARFNYPFGVAIDPSGGFALVAVRASPASPASRHPAYRRIAHDVGRTHSHRHATSRTGLALFTPCLRASQDQNNHRIRRVE